MSSCFLLTTKEDSISGIYDTLKQCAKISQNAGGIGLAIHDIRATGSYIKGTNGTSNGIVPMLRVFNDTARYVDQGGGKRKGSLPCTSSHGTRTSLTSSTCARTTERRSSAPAICSTPSGHLTCS